MPDHATPALPRIALVFGEEEAVAHVREALADHADVVYAAPAAEFDASRPVAAGAAAALVNLDGGDWLDEVETKLHAAGVAVVYNDPEISQRLEGWERARWLRHLVAKLRGSRDVDPPRPDARSPSVTTAAAEAAAPVYEFAEALPESAMIERPLSPQEIETMTADFVAEQKPPPEQGVDAAPAAAMQLGTLTSPTEADPAALDFDAETALDVDTEALSAMIDARLAQPDASESSGSPEVWREVSGDAVAPAQPDAAVAIEAKPTVDATPADAAVQAVNDEADVLAGLPSLDDWQLVDHDAAPAPVASEAARKAPEPALSDALAGVELVPMETIVPLRMDADPIERWFAEEFGKKPAPKEAAAAGVKEARREHG